MDKNKVYLKEHLDPNDEVVLEDEGVFLKRIKDKSFEVNMEMPRDRLPEELLMIAMMKHVIYDIRTSTDSRAIEAALRFLFDDDEESNAYFLSAKNICERLDWDIEKWRNVAISLAKSRHIKSSLSKVCHRLY